jgi:antirestriction protein ArdC
MASVYEIITDRICGMLEQGIIPWNKPWNGGGWPVNLVSKKHYRGINVALLATSKYSSRYWLTYQQAQDLGGHVKKDEKGTMIVFWKMLHKVETDSEGNEKEVTIPMLRYYYVFNVEQCEGIKIPSNDIPEREFTPIEEAERIVRDMPKRPEIRHGGDRAYYSPSLDYVQMPKKSQFINEEAYYSTLFHELSHSTGHSSRVNRKLDQRLAAFGSEDYSKEELVAEFSASFLCGICGIEQAVIKNSAAYIQSWLRALRNDKQMAVNAAAAAQKAADYILGKQETEQEG